MHRVAPAVDRLQTLRSWIALADQDPTHARLRDARSLRDLLMREALSAGTQHSLDALTSELASSERTGRLLFEQREPLFDAVDLAHDTLKRGEAPLEIVDARARSFEQCAQQPPRFRASRRRA
jgi:hypothetical protein